LGERILRNPNIRIRSAKKKNFQAEMAIVREIYNDAWADNWGFVPMTDDEMEETARELLPIMDEELIFFTYYNDEPVSVCLTVPDANPILRMLHGKLGPWGAVKALAYRRKIDKARILALGVKKGFRKLGVPLAAFQYLRGILVQKNYRFLEVGWNLEDNVDIIGFEKEAGCEIHNKYRIFRKDFEIG
jgi:hypothetical protein